MSENYIKKFRNVPMMRPKNLLAIHLHSSKKITFEGTVRFKDAHGTFFPPS